MEMFLSWQNKKEEIQIPVLPPTYELESKNTNKTITLHELGTINLIGKPDLRRITIESFFPAQDYPFVTTRKRHDPYFYAKTIERWRLSEKPIRLIITETMINMAFAIENFQFGVRDGSRDLYYILELSEYVFTGIKSDVDTDYKLPSEPPKSAVVASKPSTIVEVEANREEVRETPKTYIVKKGDTLTTIAKKVTGNAANFKEIAKKNGIKNPNKIEVGQVLKL